MPDTKDGISPATPRPEVTVGVSAGTDVVCCVVLSTAVDGAETFDYRTLTADGKRTDVSELVTTSLDLASEHLMRGTSTRRAGGRGRIAVAFRSDSDSRSILASARRHDIAITNDSLVPDLDAALCWLRHTGEVVRFGHIVIVDVGASGTTVSVVDQVDGTVRATERNDHVGGTVFDRRLQRAVSHRLPTVAHADRMVVAARLRTAKEQLSFHDSVSVDLPGDHILTVTRDELSTAVESSLAVLRDLVGRVVARAGDAARPEAVAVIGGGAYIPAVNGAVAEAADIPLIATVEPDAATAKGAALRARSLDHQVTVPRYNFRSYDSESGNTVSPRAASLRTAGLLAAACAAVAVVLAYGVHALTSSSETTVTTVATSVLPSDAPIAVPSPAAPPPELTGGWADPAPEQTPPSSYSWPTNSYTYTPPSRTEAPVSSAPSLPPAPESVVPQVPTQVPTTPSLRPAPDLPIIVLPDLPDLPPWLTNLPGVPPGPATQTPSTQAPGTQAPSTQAPGTQTPAGSAPGSPTPGPAASGQDYGPASRSVAPTSPGVISSPGVTASTSAAPQPTR
ncbi:MAG: Hsp70 family protein [Rhodococcus sp. (in: high G+C Gram-positive bacteria)]